MSLHVEIVLKGERYKKPLSAREFEAAKIECESVLAANPTATELNLIDDNLYNMQRRWVYFTYQNGRWSSFKSPPNKSADGW